MISVPKVGSSVTVTTQHKNVRLGEPAQIKQSYTGVVLNPEKWMIPSEFAIATGNKDFPRAIINSAYVVDIQYHKGESVQSVDSSVRTFKITSKSSGKSYIVTATPNQITCTCTGFTFRKTCKHSTKVSSFLRGQ